MGIVRLFDDRDAYGLHKYEGKKSQTVHAKMENEFWNNLSSNFHGAKIF
jgi:hypothetical protein